MKICVLLTATINPYNMSFTTLRDPKLRFNQYYDALSYYSKLDLPVIFVENSNYDLSYFKQQFNNVEFLSFDGNKYDDRLGKGVGELNCINFALLNSRLITPESYVIKITGRLKVLNLKRIADSILGEDIIANLKSNMKISDSRIFICKSTFLQNLNIYKHLLNDTNGVYFEHILAKTIIHSILEKGYEYSNFKIIPQISGMSGSNGGSYNRSWLSWLSHQIRLNISNAISPQ